MNFDDACDVVRAGLFAATDDDKLRLYGLYRVARGDAHEHRDASAVARAKQAAVQAAAHLTPRQAANAYVRLVEDKLLGATG